MRERGEPVREVRAAAADFTRRPGVCDATSLVSEERPHPVARIRRIGSAYAAEHPTRPAGRARSMPPRSAATTPVRTVPTHGTTPAAAVRERRRGRLAARPGPGPQRLRHRPGRHDPRPVPDGIPALIDLFDAHSAPAGERALQLADLDGPCRFQQGSEVACREFTRAAPADNWSRRLGEERAGCRAGVPLP
ncbi:hypothetical protein [Streptomyces sp. NPDC001250]|uniref:hypothetical protein n=1 Tax=unclassified Streptomyces TaxID=2593676 RepID=UPI00332A2667